MFLRKIISYILLIILSLSFWIKDFIAYAITPSDISNKLFFYDGQDIDWDWINTNEPSDWTRLTNIIDKFNTNTWTQIILNKKPLYKTNSINSLPSFSFDWVNDLINIKDNISISVWTWYTKRSYAMVIKTWNDINTFQTIYDEWTKEKWFSFQIENSRIYAWAYNTIDWNTPNKYKIIDLWLIQANEVYTIIFVYDKNNDFVKWYINWVLKNTLNNISTQTTHWACTFETSFNCDVYSTWWTLAIWATKNDTLRLSNSTWSIAFEWNFFKGNLWEISSYNHSLTNSEVIWLNEYLFTKWWFDRIAPVITWSNVLSGSILPWWNHSISFNYNDSHTWSLWINTWSLNLVLQKWNWTSWQNNTGISNTSISLTGATYQVNNLDYWKYRTILNISDNAPNTSSNYELIFYIDKPTLNVSTWSISIWDIDSSANNFSNDIVLTVKTIWAPFKVKLKRKEKLEDSSGNEIIYYNWNYWLGYDKNRDWNLHNFNNDIIGQQTRNVNVNWNLNTYTYRIKMWAIVEQIQTSGNYSWKIDFDIELDY